MDRMILFPDKKFFKFFIRALHTSAPMVLQEKY